jgi:hypothetical protein
MTRTHYARVAVVVLLAGPSVSACWPANDNTELGLLALMTITGPATPQPGGVQQRTAQFFPGKFPTATTSIQVPEVDSLDNLLYPGEIGRTISGRAGAGAQTIAIGLDGDVGYWVVPITIPDEQYMGQVDFSAKAQFSPNLPLGMATIHFAAVDASGHFGPSNDEQLPVIDVRAPQGYLIVHLQWDTESDLDLHVVTPAGDVLWAKGQTTFTLPPPGSPPPTPAMVKEAGILDWDSNGMCVIDGLRKEDAYWNVTAGTVPTGTYKVLVDDYSMCGQQYAGWKVWVEERTDPTTCDDTPPDGGFGDAGPPVCKTIASASGVMYPRNTEVPHTALSGTYALSFTYP